jgi:hypothetical protein
MVKRLRNEKPKIYTSAGKYAALSGCMSPVGSLEYKMWLASLPPFLLEIMKDELIAREAAAQRKSQSSSI